MAERAAAKKTAKKTTATSAQPKPKPIADSNGNPVEATNRPATVRPQRYSDGEGFKAGQRAPHTVYVDRDRAKLSKDEPDGGGWVLVQKGDVVHAPIADEYERLS